MQYSRVNGIPWAQKNSTGYLSLQQPKIDLVAYLVSTGTISAVTVMNKYLSGGRCPMLYQVALRRVA